MIRRLIFGMVLCCFVAASGEGRLEWLETSHDFGAFDESLERVTCVIKAVNRGDEPVVVIDARANCGCTIPQYSTEPVLPGDTLEIEIGYNAVGRPGRFDKSVMVTTNGRPSRQRLDITGTVVATASTLSQRYPIDYGDIRMRRDIFLFDDVERRGIVNRYIEGVNATHDTLRLRVGELPRHLSVVISPETVAPGENFVVSATFDAATCPLVDYVFDSIPILGTTERVEMSTVARVYVDYSSLTAEEVAQGPRVSITPDILDCGRIEVPTTKPMKFKVKISNTGIKPLHIQRIYSLDKSLQFKLKGQTTVKAGKSVTLEINVPSEALEGYDILNDRIVVITDDPRTPRQTIRLLGEIVRVN